MMGNAGPRHWLPLLRQVHCTNEAASADQPFDPGSGVRYTESVSAIGSQSREIGEGYSPRDFGGRATGPTTQNTAPRTAAPKAQKATGPNPNNSQSRQKIQRPDQQGRGAVVLSDGDRIGAAGRLDFIIIINIGDFFLPFGARKMRHLTENSDEVSHFFA